MFLFQSLIECLTLGDQEEIFSGVYPKSAHLNNFFLGSWCKSLECFSHSAVVLMPLGPSIPVMLWVIWVQELQFIVFKRDQH